MSAYRASKRSKEEERNSTASWSSPGGGSGPPAARCRPPQDLIALRLDDVQRDPAQVLDPVPQSRTPFVARRPTADPSLASR